MHGTLQVCRTQTSVLSNHRQNERFGHLKREPLKREIGVFFHTIIFQRDLLLFDNQKNYLIRDLYSKSLANESNWVDFFR